MFNNQNFVFGTVIDCSPENTLTVQLENGETGVVEMAQAGRRNFKAGARLNWMIGMRRGFCAGDMGEDGRRMLSARAFEENEYRRIVEDFQQKKRNVYMGTLVTVSQDGKLAYYEIAQGVSASASIGDFSRMRAASFYQISVPKQIPVVVKSFHDATGCLRVTTVPVFGDFRTNVEKLQLQVGSVVPGYVSSEAHNVAGVIISLAPNLTIRSAVGTVGSWVNVEILSIDEECQTIRGHVKGWCDEHPRSFDMLRWVQPLEELPEYIDLQEFYPRVCPKERAVMPAPQAAESENGLDLLLQKLEGEASPFALKEGETGARVPINSCKVQKILQGSMSGRLQNKHMVIAKAVNALKYATMAQVKEYLQLQEDMELSDAELRHDIEELLRYDIVHALNIMDGDTAVLPGVLYPGAMNYFKYTGMARYLPTWQYNTEPDVSLIKCYLSANWLLLGMLREKGKSVALEPRVYIRLSEELRIRPRFRLIQSNGKGLYLESARSNWLNGMLEKLQRYERYFDFSQEKAEVLITLESRDAVEDFARDVAALKLKFDVCITCDADCLPCPTFCRVPAHVPQQRGVLNRLVGWLRS